MPSAPHNATTETRRAFLRSRWIDFLLIFIVGLLLAQIYAPLLLKIGKTTISSPQLNTGGLLVLFAMAICLRDIIGKVPIEPNLNSHGLGLLFLGFACLWFAGRLQRAALPLVLLSFCLAMAAIISFLYGKLGVRHFMPALGGFLMFGLLVGLFPTLDWPLREIAGKFSAAVLNWMSIPVELVRIPSRPPEILLRSEEH